MQLVGEGNAIGWGMLHTSWIKTKQWLLTMPNTPSPTAG